MDLTKVLTDPATGDLIVEGEFDRQALAQYYGQPQSINCARPRQWMPLPEPAPAGSAPRLQVHKIYHHSLVDGPGRRSVLQLQGCPIRCPGCYVPETHDPTTGVSLSLEQVLDCLLDPSGEPRTGFTILGGEPFAQAPALYQLLRRLPRAQEQPGYGLVPLDRLVYTGFTIEFLWEQGSDLQRACLTEIDYLIDGPYRHDLRHNSGPWRGSSNQRLWRLPDWLRTRALEAA